MRHMNTGRQLSRNSAHRLALMKNMLSSLLKHGRITTTVAKAKELRIHADRFITIGKKDSIPARRQAATWIHDRTLLTKLFNDYAKRYADRHGGYTRILQLGPRLGDAAPMAMIEYIPATNATTPTPTTTKAAKAKPAAKVAKADKAPKAKAKAAKPAKKAAKK